MRSCKIISYLVQATPSDIFYKEIGKMFINKEIFYKSQFTGEFEGPYLLSEDFDYYELMVQISMGMIYVLDPKSEAESNVPFEMILCEASPDDIKADQKLLKFNMSFYLLAENHKMTGPFYLFPNIDVDKLKQNLDKKNVFIIDKNQTFKIIENKIAV